MGTHDFVVKLCRNHNISVNDLEKKLGFGQGSIGKMRTSIPKADRLQKIADYFNVSIEYLMTGKDPVLEEQLASLPYDRSDVEKAMTLFHQYEQAPPEIQSAIETLLKASQPET